MKFRIYLNQKRNKSNYDWERGFKYYVLTLKKKYNVLIVLMLYCKTLLLLLRCDTGKVRDRYGGIGRFKGGFKYERWVSCVITEVIT